MLEHPHKVAVEYPNVRLINQREIRTMTHAGAVDGST